MNKRERKSVTARRHVVRAVLMIAVNYCNDNRMYELILSASYQFAHTGLFQQIHLFTYNIGNFLPRCMECRRGIAMRFLSVRPSVRPSVKRVLCDKTEEKSVQIFIPCDR